MRREEVWDPIWTAGRAGPEWLHYCNGHPVSRLLGLRAVACADGSMTFELTGVPAPNPNGSVHGGLLAAALDNALAMAAMTAMRDDGLPNTAGMNVQYLRPAMAPLTIEATVTRGGRSMVFVRAEVRNAGGEACATADGTFAVVSARHVNAR